MSTDPAAGTAPFDRRLMLRSVGAALAAAPLRAFAGVWGQALAAGEAPGRVLSGDQLALVAEICERILPRTDTPGARDALVHRFVDVLLADWFGAEERAAFVAGLAALERQCVLRHGMGFVAANDTQRDELLRTLEDEAIAQRAGRPWTLQPENVEPPMLRGLHFFDVARWLTLVGYYTSEVGMRQELSWRGVPGHYDGCRTA